MKSFKYIFSSIVAGTLAIGVVSCDLEEYNPTGTTADTIWETEQGFKTVVNAAYHFQRNFYGKVDALFMTESGTDLWFNQNKDTYSQQLSKYEGFTADASNFNRSSFATFYQAINYANTGLGRIGEVSFSSPAERNRREAELRFLRGYYYWHVVETWGGVHLKLNEVPTFTAQRSSVEAFYDVIIPDLEFAAQNLPNQSVWGDEYSRASKKSALGFLARALLSRAYYSPVGSPERENYFMRARNIAQNIIDRQGELEIGLWNNYADNFSQANLANARNNKEAMYIISNAGVENMNWNIGGNLLHLWYMTKYNGKPGLQKIDYKYGFDDEPRLMPTLALLDFYDESKDSRYHASFQEVWIALTPLTLSAAILRNPAFAGVGKSKDLSLLNRTIRPDIDTAMVITKKSITDEAQRPYIVIDRDSVYNTGSNNSIKIGSNYVRLKKFHDPNRVQPTTKPGANDIVLMRFAEMYLIAAEAEFQLGNTAKAAEYLNVLRTRAALPDKVAEMQITQDAVTLDFILDERARELAGEHIRWFDLKRTGKLVDRIRRYNPDITAVQEYHRLRPVPQQEIDALINGQEFGQNPDY